MRNIKEISANSSPAGNNSFNIFNSVRYFQNSINQIHIFDKGFCLNFFREEIYLKMVQEGTDVPTLRAGSQPV